VLVPTPALSILGQTVTRDAAAMLPVCCHVVTMAHRCPFEVYPIGSNPAKNCLEWDGAAYVHTGTWHGMECVGGEVH